MIFAPALLDLPDVSGSTPQLRAVDYLRISITDRCNERCLYCLPEQFQSWLPRQEILSYDEILALADVAVERGFRHFRVTGGEPLLRAGVTGFLGDLIRLPGVETVSLTTNGTRLFDLADDLHRHGVRRINVSLDALDPQHYHDITRGNVEKVVAGIDRALALGMTVKLNTVLIRHKNEEELWPLVQFAAARKIPIRFIELMPVSLTEMLTEENFLPVGEAMRLLSEKDSLVPLDRKLGQGPARYFRMPTNDAIIGFIGALTNLHFCESCNKIRLTADGFLRPCLGNHGEFDLKSALRPVIDHAQLDRVLRQALREKPPEHIFRQNWQPQRIMTAIGG